MSIAQEKTVVMAFGTFDFFHAGHEFYLKQAKSMGNYLIIVVARDRTVQQIKGKSAVHSERKRLNKLKKLGIADKVVLGHHTDKHKVLKKYRPSVIALGYDQFVFTQTINKTLIDLNLNTSIQRIEAHYPQVYKSSLIKNRILSEKDSKNELNLPSLNREAISTDPA